MDSKILEELGLTSNESKVYLALLRLGIASVSSISKESNVDRTLIYELLSKLSSKGLVSSVVKTNKRYYEAASPEKLQALLDEKEATLKSVMPQLMGLYDFKQEKQDVHFFKGKQGVKTILEQLLVEKSEWKIFGVNKATKENIASYLPQLHRKRIEKKQFFRAIFSDESLDRAREIAAMKFTEVRILSSDYMTPTHISIVDDKLAIILWSEDPIGILIESNEIAKGFETYFKILWTLARPINIGRKSRN
jgi:HTH-type transcriptional regulator, sugar sensing transcriptional regulator